MKKILFILLLGSSCFSIGAQKVTISEDINLRTDFLYDILGKVDNKILLYRDKGLDHTLQIFDDNLWEKESVELQFEKKRIDILGLVPSEVDFSFFYSYRIKGDQILACRKFDSSGQLLDTATIATNNLLLNYQKYYYAYDKEKRFVALFSFMRDNAVQVHMFDTKEMKEMWTNIYAFDFAFIRRDFRELIVTNKGGAFFIFEKENFRKINPIATIDLFYLDHNDGGLSEESLVIKDKYLIDYKVDFDNVNNKLIIGGLYGERFRSRADGYFIFNRNLLNFYPFDQSLYSELELNSKKRVNNLEDYIIADMVLRRDGGVILISEMQREFSRKSGTTDGRRQSFDIRAYVDFYNEDIIIFSTHPDGKEHWRKILRKKQFSQDDGGYYSSFFTFKSPTELRLIFNDEIKLDNTVSEYIVNPIGENERNIVMNTEYQKLKLRFVQAIQISNKDFLVPSERNNKFNLVKVSF